MTPRSTLPNVTDEPREAFTCGWRNGILAGICIGAGGMVVVLSQLGMLR